MLRKPILYLLFSLLCIAGAVVWAVWPDSTGEKPFNPGSDLRKLHDAALEVLPDKAAITVNLSGDAGRYGSEEELLALGSKIGALSDMPELKQNKASARGDHLRYIAEKDAGSLRITLHLVELAEGRSYYMYVIESSLSKLNIAELESVQARLLERFRSIGMSPEWHAMVQGERQREQDGASLLSPVLTSLRSKLALSEVETYEDDRSASATYYSSDLTSLVDSGGKAVNMQIAVHLVTGADRARITLAIPAATGEF